MTALAMIFDVIIGFSDDGNGVGGLFSLAKIPYRFTAVGNRLIFHVAGHSSQEN